MSWPFAPGPDPRKDVGTDIFSMLSFLSPRQGPSDTTVQQPDEPPPAPPPAPPEVPLPPPVSTRKVTPPQVGPAPPPPDLSGAGGDPSLAGGAGADTLPVGPDGQPIVVRPGEPTPGPPPPVGAAPSLVGAPVPSAPPVGAAPPIAPPLPVSNPDGGPPVTPTAKPIPKNVNPLPPLPDPGEGIDKLMKIYEQQRADAKRERFGDALSDMGFSLGAALTRSPSARTALSGMVGKGGRGGGTGSGDASISDLLNIQKLATASQQAKADNALIPVIAERAQESEAAIRAMTPEDRSKYMSKIMDGSNVVKDEKDDGSATFIDARTGSIIATVKPDAYKQAKEADRRAGEARTAELHPGVMKRQGVDLAGEEQRQRLADTKEGRDVELHPTVVKQGEATLAKTTSDTRINEATEARTTEALNQRLSIVDDVAKRNPDIPRGTLESLARIGGEGWTKAASNDYEIKVLANGTAVAVDKKNPSAPTRPLYSDPDKAAEVAAALKSTQATTDKVTEEAKALADKNVKNADFRKMMSNEESRAKLAAAIDMEPDELEAAYLSNTQDDVIKARINSVPLYQEWLKTDKSKTFTQYAEQERKSKTVQPSPDKIFLEAAAKDTLTKVETRGKALSSLPEIQRRYSALLNSEVYTGAVQGSSLFQKGVGLLAEGLGVDTKKLSKTEDYVNTTLNESINEAKTLGVNPTDTDLKMIRAAKGSDLTQTRDALILNQQFQARTQIRRALAAEQSVNTSMRLFKDDPGTQAYLKEQIKDLPDYTNTMFPKADSDKLTAIANSPLSPEAKLKAVADFDKTFGDGMGAYFLAKKGLAQPAEPAMPQGANQ